MSVKITQTELCFDLVTGFLNRLGIKSGPAAIRVSDLCEMYNSSVEPRYQMHIKSFSKHIKASGITTRRGCMERGHRYTYALINKVIIGQMKPFTIDITQEALLDDYDLISDPAKFIDVQLKNYKMNNYEAKQAYLYEVKATKKDREILMNRLWLEYAMVYSHHKEQRGNTIIPDKCPKEMFRWLFRLKMQELLEESPDVRQN